MFYNLNKSNKISAETIKEVKNIRRQYFKTDVYFQVVLNNGFVISFIIEDKVNTSHHSDQLQRYKIEIESDGEKEDEIVLIYYKTGYIFDWDNKAIDFGYSILTAKLVSEFLEKYQIINPIFTDYKEYVKNINDFYQKAYKELFSTNEGYKQFVYDFTQIEFMKELFNRCPDNVNNYHSVNNGKSIGGSPWTCLNFLYIEKMVNEFPEMLFYKLDQRANGFNISLRHYSYFKNSSNIDSAKKEKIKRLNFYIDIFNSIKAEEITKLQFGKINRDLSGAFDSDIAVIYFDSDKNTVQNVLTELPKFHKVFVNAVRKAMNL